MSVLDPNLDINYGCLIHQTDIQTFASISEQLDVETHRKRQLDLIRIRSILEDWLNTRTCCPASTEIKSILSQTLGIPKKVLKVRRTRCIYEKGVRLRVFHDIKVSNGTAFEINGHKYKLISVHFNWSLNAFAPKDNYKF